jgi:hypothetical protein
MPEVENILQWLGKIPITPVTLLVVPGLPWSKWQIHRLRELANAGYELAAHGWLHHTRPRRMTHRLHAQFFSRNVAEHLDLDADAIYDLMCRSADWFTAHDLPRPLIYVPPAWALGTVSWDKIRQTPFEIIETAMGVHLLRAAPNQRLIRLPLTGYEADTVPRAAFLRRWNSFQMMYARQNHRPLRIAIHPYDFQYHLACQLRHHLENAGKTMSYSALLS